LAETSQTAVKLIAVLLLILDYFTEGIRDVIIYTNPDEPAKRNRGFCFIDFDCHKNASGAKRKLENGQALVWNRQVIVSWAEPQEEPDEDTMAKVC
jgi:hypothetical protein